jgi:hypothetical protein
MIGKIMVEIREIHKKQTNTMPAIEREELVKKMRKEDDKIRKGLFEFLDAQGGWLDFSYRKYPGEPIQTIRITHGEICDLPMGLIKHLNNTKKNIPMEGGRPPRSFEVISRCRFTPMDVM